jgi:predicted nucleic acid binding AN1-type Zn finger protein
MKDVIEIPVKINTKKPRCPICNKKLGLMLFTCQCERRFCIGHVQPELHDCTYDHKTKQRKELEKQLIKVVADKVIKI